jgi:hypothetical protein
VQGRDATGHQRSNVLLQQSITCCVIFCVPCSLSNMLNFYINTASVLLGWGLVSPSQYNAGMVEKDLT